METEAIETVLKVERFENAPFLVWTGEKGGFRKR